MNTPHCMARTIPEATPLWVPAALSMGTVAALGLARFAYSLLLPAMQADLNWSYAQAGALNTAIAAGYLAGALCMERISRVLGAKRAFLLGLWLTAAVLMCTGFCRSFQALLTARFIAGFVTASVFAGGFSLAAHAGAVSGRSTLYSSVYMAGAGIGIVLSGLLLPRLLAAGAGWSAGWLALGALTLAAGGVAYPALRRLPEPPVAVASGVGSTLSRRLPIFLAYSIFGAGYFALLTFVVAYLHAAGYPHARVVGFWIIAGVALILSTAAWGPILSRLSGRRGVTATTATLIASALLLLFAHGPLAVYAAAVLFGGSFVACATAQIDFARRLTPPQQWTRLIAALTVGFAAGQCVGPLLSGLVSDLIGGLRAGVVAAVVLLLLCMLAAALQGSHIARPDK